MATRMQQRRGTAAQWTAANPILAAAEIGFESDTNQFKMGDGVNHWADLSYFKNLDSLGGNLDDYILLTEKGAANGVAELDGSGKVPSSQLPDSLSFDAEVTNAVSTAMATEVTDRNNAIATAKSEAISAAATDATTKADNAKSGAEATAASALSAHEADTTNIHGIANTAALATKTYVDSAAAAAVLGVVDNAPDLLNTLNELSAAIANDPGFANTVLTSVEAAQLAAQGFATDAIGTAITNEVTSRNGAISTHNSHTIDVHGIANTAALVTESILNSALTDVANAYTNAISEASAQTLVNYSNAIATHGAVTTNVHGIADTTALATKTFATGKATDAQTAAEATAASALSTHAGKTTDVHGIANTAALATKAYADNAVSTHEADTTNVHGIADTSALATKSYADGKASNAQSAAQSYTDSAIAALPAELTAGTGIAIANGVINANTVALTNTNYGLTDSVIGVTTDIDGKLVMSDISIANRLAGTGIKSNKTNGLYHLEVDRSTVDGWYDASGTAANAISTHDVTTNVHGIADTSLLVTTTGTQTLTNKTITSPSGLVKADVGLGNVNNTSDANKPVSTATQTALDAKAPIASPTFTGTVSGITKSMVGLGNVDNTSDANKPVSSATQTALNLKANLASPTFTGTVNADNVTISGNLTVTGSTTTVDTTNLSVTDSLIYLADSQFTADAVDIGIYGAYGNANTSANSHPHTGLVRDASDGKWKLISGGEEPANNIVNFATATKDTLVIGALDATSATIGNVSNTELQYLDGVTSAIQTQIDAKAPLASPTFTGTVTLPTGTVTSAMILDGTIVNADINATAAIAATKIAGTAVTQADSGTVTSTMIADGTIVNGDISSSAAIAYGKLNVSNSIVNADINSSAAIAYGKLNVSNSIVNADINSSAAIAYGKLNVSNAIVNADINSSAAIAYGKLNVANSIVDADINSSAAIAQSKISGLTTALAAKAPTASPTFTGTVTVASAGIAFSDGTQTGEGVISRTPIVQKTASYTLSALTERDSLIEISSSTAVTLTVPPNSSVAYPVGTSIDILQTNTGQITVAAGAGVTVNATPGLKLRTQWSGATLFKRATDTWVLYGDLSA